MKAKLLWLGLSVSGLIAFFSFALLPGPPPAPPSAVVPTQAVASTLRMVPAGAGPAPVPYTNGVPVPSETPYDDRPEAKAHYLQDYCDGYRLGASSTNWVISTSCYFGPMPPPENVLAAQAGWSAGQAAGHASKPLKPRVVRRKTNADGNEILTMQFP